MTADQLGDFGTASTTYQVVLAPRDGDSITITCPADSTVLDAAAEAEYRLPSLCGQGTCGACRARVVEGSIEIGAHSAEALSDSEAAAGEVLLCRTFPRGDLTIELPYDRSRILSEAIPVRGVEIAALDEVAHNTVRLELALLPHPTLGTGAEFEPGQFIQIEIPGEEVRRAYSLANVPNWDGELELFIRKVPGGHFSTYLDQRAKVGDRLFVHGPQGAFGLRDHGLRPRIFVGGGTGVAPLLSMLRRMAEFGELHESRLYLGFNNEDDMFGAEAIAELSERLAHFTAQVSLWRPGPSWSHPGETPVDALRRDLPDLATTPDVYCCGPPPLIEGVAKLAAEFGIPDSQVFAEKFLPN